MRSEMPRERQSPMFEAPCRCALAAFLWMSAIPASAAPPASVSVNPGTTADQGAAPVDRALSVPGYFDSATGTFQTLDAPASGLVKRYGSVQIVGTISVNGSIPTSVPINALPEIDATDGLYHIYGSGTATLMRAGQNTASLKLTIPYTWQESSAAVPISVSVTFYASVTNSNGQTTQWSNVWQTTSALPANGKVLTLTAHGAL